MFEKIVNDGGLGTRFRVSSIDPRCDATRFGSAFAIVVRSVLERRALQSRSYGFVREKAVENIYVHATVVA